MALTSAQYRRGGANGGVTDADGRTFMVAAGGIGDTVGSSIGTASAPASGGSVLTVSAPAAGTYDVEVTTFQTGTVDTNPQNMVFRKASVFVGQLPSLATPFSTRFRRVTVDGTQALNVFASGTAAGASSVYNATLRYTRVE